jgi:hypothetical protein
MESTTSELIVALSSVLKKKMSVSQDTIENLERVKTSRFSEICQIKTA